MLQAHFAWAAERLGSEWKARLLKHLGANDSGPVASGIVLATEWIPLRTLVEIDRAIAAEAGDPEAFRKLGRHSAVLNLGGVYKSFVQEEPHRFFEQMALLHRRFLNFGRCAYEPAGPRAGRVRMENYPEYSSVFCGSAIGYYEGALQMMHVPGPIVASETRCHCAGDGVCLFELGW